MSALIDRFNVTKVVVTTSSGDVQTYKGKGIMTTEGVGPDKIEGISMWLDLEEKE